MDYDFCRLLTTNPFNLGLKLLVSRRRFLRYLQKINDSNSHEPSRPFCGFVTE